MGDFERAIGLYMFLQEFAQLRTRPVRDVATYARQGPVLWPPTSRVNRAATALRGIARSLQATTTSPT